MLSRLFQNAGEKPNTFATEHLRDLTRLSPRCTSSGVSLPMSRVSRKTGRHLIDYVLDV